MGALGLGACAAPGDPGAGAPLRPSATPPGAAAPAASPGASAAAPGAAATPPAAAALSASSLVGTRWTGVVPGTPDPRTLPRLEFSSQGRVLGFTGCNMLTGTWRVDGSAVRFGPLVTTKRACVGPEMEFERRLLAAMGQDSRAVLEGGRLVMIGPAGDRFEFVEAAAT
jgi:heat shock protein HslJ